MSKTPENKRQWEEKQRRQQVKREEMMSHKLTVRGGEYRPGVLWGVNWPACITGWVLSLVTGLILLAFAGAIFGPLITLGFTIKTLLAGTAGIIAGLVLLIIAFVSFFVGGWIAGRLAGFNGAVHGVMTVVVGLLIAIVFGIVASIIAGSISSFVSAAVPGFLVANIAALLSFSGLILLIVQIAGAALGGWLGEKAIGAIPAHA